MIGFKKLICKIFLSSDTISLGDRQSKSGITGAKVIGRGVITVDGKIVASSKEFLALKKQAAKIQEAVDKILAPIIKSVISS